MGVGFAKPHIPYVAPAHYFSLYDNNTYPGGVLPLPLHPDYPLNAPRVGTNHNSEASDYPDIRAVINDVNYTMKVPDWKARELRRGYYAVASFVDAQVGRVLQVISHCAWRCPVVKILLCPSLWYSDQNPASASP